MIIKRVEQHNIIKVLYESSNVLASNYDKVLKDLVLTFNNGSQYKYQNVTASDYVRFETAEKQGSEFHKIIKPKYEGLSVGKVEVEDIKNEIISIVDNDIKALEKEFIGMLENIVTIYKNKTVIELYDLEVISKYVSSLSEMKKIVF
jgi:hypothetical protein